MKLDGIFTNGMILQRDAENEIWGFEDSAENVEIELDGVKVTAKTENGRFRAKLPAHSVAVGLTMTVRGSTTVIIDDICFGDVLLLTGQSNMELPIGRVLDVSPDVVNDEYPLIRQFSVRPLFSVGKPAGFIPENKWVKASGEEILQFSASGYFAARGIFEEKKVPVGLLLLAQGGSTIESWMPGELLNEFGDYIKETERFSGENVLGRYIDERNREISEWVAEQETGEESDFCAKVPVGAKKYTVPSLLRDSELKGFAGSLWFYKDAEVENEVSGECLLRVGDLIDSDRTYVNGVKVGEIGYRYPPRKYRFDGSLLKKGHNLIAVRLLVNGGDGGFVPAHQYRLETSNGNIDLSGEWEYVIEHRADSYSPEVCMAQHVPTWLYNGSIVPLKGLSFAGTLWYQGESNADDWERYDEKFAAMIKAWRMTLGQKLPVVCVEMCDYIEPLDPSGEESPFGWAKIQQFQRNAANYTENCRSVSAKDLGEVLELHPQKKEELGRRIAGAALDIFDM